ncbi:FAD binding domain-containing protein [Mesorhizobium sp. PUT5]|uniref:FAD binding domain-containing protein n=1 Tax=Mesorhizobium sp. PUT5 TaxID=3454629 RepID=UPI003FA4B9DF
MTALAPARPTDLAALARLMAGPLPVRFIAGGTDLLLPGRPLPRQGLLVDVSAINGLAGIKADGGDIEIGGATTVAALAAHAGLAKRFPALGQAAAECGSVQIRNRATLGGNVANAAPAADLVPVLALAEARLRLMMPGGASAEIPLGDFHPEAGGLIVKAVLPEARLLPRSAFAKLGPRRDLTISRLNMAAMGEFSNGRFGALRLVAGSLGPRPIRLGRAGAALAGRPLTSAALRDFMQALSEEVNAAIPGRASRSWKRQAIRGLGLDLIARLCGLSPRDPLFDEAL